MGEIVTDHASSWVRRLPSPAPGYYVKTYDYPGWRSRWGGLLRHTGPLLRSRAAREFDALCWYGKNSSFAAEPIAVFENRRFGCVRRAILVTQACPGTRLDHLLAAAEPDSRRELAEALGSFVATMHANGGRDGNLDLRNLLAHRHDEDQPWQLAKIDSPRFRVRPPGHRRDRWTRADWQRLLPQLQPFGIADIVQRRGHAG